LREFFPHHLVIRGVASSIFLVFASVSFAESLPQLIEDAIANDAKFSSADAQFRANLQREPEARAAFLPHLALTQSDFRNAIHVPGKPAAPYSTLGTTLSLNQSVLKWDDWETYRESKLVAINAGFVLAAARQDVLLRIMQAYLDALGAQDEAALAREHTLTLSEQLAMSRRSFALGASTVVDLNEAQAGFDAAQADQLRADAEVLRRYAALEKIVGHPVDGVESLAADVDAPMLSAESADAWIDAAVVQSWDVKQQEIALEIAAREVSKVNAGYLPSISIVGNVNHGNAAFINGQTNFYTGANRATSGEIGVQISIPLFDGLETHSKKTEMLALEDKAHSDLEDIRRSAALDARQSFLGVQEGIAQIAALRTAQVSAETSLRSNQKGFRTGVRINADVLNAEEKLFSTRRNLAKARYDTLLQYIRLKASVAQLDDASLAALTGNAVTPQQASAE